jgi:SAM-dependent methyltransferase
MGLNRRHIAFLAASRQVGVSFERTLTIGRQTLFADEGSLTSALGEAGATIDSDTARRIVGGDGFCEPFIEYLGASQVDSLDASGYEGSSIVHDLNVPLPDALKGSFSVVLDSGTLEHVFDFPQALRNCLDAVRVGGHFITITPTNNQLGHGFYQFSPELYYRVLAPENGFRVACMLLRAERRAARWYAAADPADIGRRIMLSGAFPCYLYVVGQRVEQRDPLAEHPQQSDYAAAWTGDDSALTPKVRRLPDMPLPVAQAYEWLRLLLNRPSESGLNAVRLERLAQDVPQARR